ncbi:NUDIX domain-containing protein [Suicoccus acidiformans]|uniref:NUDIX domain-containing protein n=1 Tax=Suicoccus acidiformans TaxID=2036206 RepID=A0A347WLK4_9LACT|nr:NUDIX hydrolase [Suicoccus acidiformans]AXY25961.1 NUDIX domain-containing protein [Suicoccus acidiformans]
METDQAFIPFMQDSLLKASRQVYDGAILQLYVNELELETGQVVQRELIHHLPAVGILASQGNQVLLVEQHRAATATKMLEIPAGIIDFEAGQLEQAELAARRELEEETGYQAERWRYLGEYYVTPGYNDERILFYQAEQLSEVAEPLSQDDDENVTAAWYEREAVLAMLEANDIKDMKTVLALQYWINQKE